MWISLWSQYFYGISFTIIINFGCGRIVNDSPKNSGEILFRKTFFYSLVPKYFFNYIFLQFVIYGGYCIFIALLLLVLFLVRESHRGWGNYFHRLSEQGFWQSDKPGKEDDVECRQSSLAGAIEATK